MMMNSPSALHRAALRRCVLRTEFWLELQALSNIYRTSFIGSWLSFLSARGWQIGMRKHRIYVSSESHKKFSRIWLNYGEIFHFHRRLTSPRWSSLWETPNEDARVEKTFPITTPIRSRSQLLYFFLLSSLTLLPRCSRSHRKSAKFASWD